MQRTKSKPDSSSLLPRDAQPCIWMTAGLIACRLCNRDYECDNCPLDIALRSGNRQLPPEPKSENDLTPAPDLRYGASHTWGCDMARRRIRFGLDAFAAGLLSNVSGVVLPVKGQRVRRGRVACWFRDEDQILPLRTPACGVVHRVNRSVQSDPALLSHDPYGEGWLFELDCATGLDRLPDWVSAHQHLQRVESGRRRLQENAVRIFERDPGIGPTLADGGTHVADLRRILGARRYFRLLRSILE
jgi:glycine cleavage system H protein